jgi:hypothetical protein
MFLLQMLLLNQNIDQPLFLMMILGPVHASNLCHTIYHEAKDVSIMKIEDYEQLHHVPNCVPTMHNIHVHQYYRIFHKISSMECINHMLRTCANCVHLPICQPCASTNMPNKCHITHDMSPPCTKYHNHVSQSIKCLNYIIPYFMYQSIC